MITLLSPRIGGTVEGKLLRNHAVSETCDLPRQGSHSTSNTGAGNTATGFEALEFNTTGNFNTATGSTAVEPSKQAYFSVSRHV